MSERWVEVPLHSCAAVGGPAEEIRTVNGAIRPQIQIWSNERQFRRIVNTSADRHLDLQIDGHVVLDFTNPVIKGMAVFPCHLLNHEDKGMMAKILME